MTFLISGAHINPIYLIVVGFIVGILGGFFGVGGSFLAGPALYAVSVPMNFVVGTDLAHIVGKSIVAARRHRALGNIDMKLGAFMVVGTIVGVEFGAQVIQWLKRTAHIDTAVGLTFVFILLGISSFMTWESVKTLRSQKKRQGKPQKTGGHPSRRDHSAMGHIARKIQGIRLPPYVSLPVSGVASISIWVILGVALLGGFFSGFLGGGAGYIRMPCMIYLLGIPTHIAVGTDLFEIIISASYGTVSHALKGNVDIVIALVMHTGAAIGAQIGATLTQFFGGPKIRMAFIPLPLLGAIIIIHSLLTGHRAH
ncbi:MAG TPA: sulfite exporter TauE/SafE family protein [Candidatus Dormibacteraeota bacterium]|nr:sulfite exporter TauE/SafE family protein [Candidatus Dormibacteraeota bacterium]